MILRVTVDNAFNIVAVQAKTLGAPYLAQCQTIAPDYQKMVGLNIVNGFRPAIRELFEGVEGCTHLTELANSLPTVVIQGVAVELNVRHRNAVGEEKAVDHSKSINATRWPKVRRRSNSIIRSGINSRKLSRPTKKAAHFMLM